MLALFRGASSPETKSQDAFKRVFQHTRAPRSCPGPRAWPTGPSRKSRGASTSHGTMRPCMDRRIHPSHPSMDRPIHGEADTRRRGQGKASLEPPTASSPSSSSKHRPKQAPKSWVGYKHQPSRDQLRHAGPAPCACHLDTCAACASWPATSSALGSELSRDELQQRHTIRHDTRRNLQLVGEELGMRRPTPRRPGTKCLQHLRARVFT